MLETRHPAQSTLRERVARREGTSSLPLPTPDLQGASPRRAVSPLPTPRQSPQTPPRVGSRLARSEARLMSLAMTCTACICGLLILYLAAYARITTLGIAQSHQRMLLRQATLENETLKAECAALQSPHRIIAAVTAQGMTRDTPPATYIAPTSLLTMQGQGAGSAQVAPRETRLPDNAVSDDPAARRP